MTAAGARNAAATLLTLAVLAGCSQKQAEAPPVEPVGATAPAPRPQAATLASLRRDRAEAARHAEANAAAGSAESVNMKTYLRGVEDQLVARGLLREDSAASDATVTAASLVRDFVQIALYDEYGPDGRGPVPAPLRRWEVPVRFQLDFGASVDAAARARDRTLTAQLAARLASASRHPVSLVAEGGNFHVLVLSEDERANIAPRLQRLVPDIPASDLAKLRDLAPQNFCTVFAYSRGGGSTYAVAVAVIRAELPPRLRRSCFHEELAQGLGLANDSPTARPSIFNDDEEFALLTKHDELLLRMLYDPRLRPGMREDEARPIAQEIASGIFPAS